MTQHQRVTLGSITAVYGVKGWVKIYSNTEPMDNIFNYKPWLINIDGQWQEVEVKHGKRHGKGLIAQLQGCDDRNQAKRYVGYDLVTYQDRLPVLDEGDYYWSQLTGLNVVTESGVKLGKVDHLIATGANDVLVVKGSQDSLDKTERLIPWLPDQVVTKIDLSEGVIRVDWDPDF